MTSMLGKVRSTRRQTQHYEISDPLIQREALTRDKKQVTYTKEKLEWPPTSTYQHRKL